MLFLCKIVFNLFKKWSQSVQHDFGWFWGIFENPLSTRFVLDFSDKMAFVTCVLKPCGVYTLISYRRSIYVTVRDACTTEFRLTSNNNKCPAIVVVMHSRSCLNCRRWPSEGEVLEVRPRSEVSQGGTHSVYDSDCLRFRTFFSTVTLLHIFFPIISFVPITFDHFFL